MENIKTNHLNFTAFFDETGSITNDTPEIFGGSLFIIEDSDIKQCREFLKTYYPKGIHCKELRKNKRLRISEDVGAFLKDKNCCAVTNIQINKNLMKRNKQIIESKYPYQPTSKDLSLSKRFYNYNAILRNPLFGIYSLIKSSVPKKITINIFMENIIRDKTMDHWDLHLENLNRSLEIYKIRLKNNMKMIDIINQTTIVRPKSKTKSEEIMFSFPDLFAFSIRRIVTHKEYGLYNKLKPVFDKFPFGSYCDSKQIKSLPNGVFIEFVQSEELDRLSELDEKEWYEDLDNWLGNSQSKNPLSKIPFNFLWRHEGEGF